MNSQLKKFSLKEMKTITEPTNRKVKGNQNTVTI